MIKPVANPEIFKRGVGDELAAHSAAIFILTSFNRGKRGARAPGPATENYMNVLFYSRYRSKLITRVRLEKEMAGLDTHGMSSCSI